MDFKRIAYLMRPLHKLSCLATLVLLSGCGEHNQMSRGKAANLAVYHTFSVRAPVSANGVLPTTHMHVFSDTVVQTITQQMVGKGYAFTNSNPDIIIAPIWWVNTRTRATAFNSTAANNGGAVPVMNTAASLEIDVLDGKTLKALWRGVQEYNLSGGEFSQTKVQKAVKDVIGPYPNAAGFQPIIPVTVEPSPVTTKQTAPAPATPIIAPAQPQATPPVPAHNAQAAASSTTPEPITPPAIPPTLPNQPMNPPSTVANQPNTNTSGREVVAHWQEGGVDDSMVKQGIDNPAMPATSQ